METENEIFYFENKKITRKEAQTLTIQKLGHNDYSELFFHYVPEPEKEIWTDYASLAGLNLYLKYRSNALAPKPDTKGSKQAAGYKGFNCTFNTARHGGREINFGVKSPTHVLTGGITNTFGVELEVCRGYVPDQIMLQQDINVTCEFDGSLRDPDGKELGSEFITGVLTGDEGLVNLQKLCNVLSDRCLVDRRCGLHVHVGVDPTPSFIVAAYKLACDIQDEMFSLVAPSRRNNDTCGHLPDHRQMIKENITTYGYHAGLKEAYQNLYRLFSNSRELDKNVNKKYMHPGKKYTDRYSNPAYADIKKLYRYKVINFIPCTFNMRNKNSDKIEEIPYTLEFRCHQGTTNFHKIKNWVLLCLAFVRFVENNSAHILVTDKVFTINDILSVYEQNPVIYRTLINYFEKRKNKFAIPDESEETKEYETSEIVTLKRKELINI